MKIARVPESGYVLPVPGCGTTALACVSGLITGVAASSPLFSFRNTGAKQVLVRRLGLGWITTTAFGTAQIVDFEVVVGRSWSADDTGGTAIALTGNNGKRRTAEATLAGVTCLMAITAALTAGTRTLDANSIAISSAWSGGLGQGIAIAPWNLMDTTDHSNPLLLAQNEGFIIRNITAFGATGVGKLYVSAEFHETDEY